MRVPWRPKLLQSRRRYGKNASKKDNEEPMIRSRLRAYYLLFVAGALYVRMSTVCQHQARLERLKADGKEQDLAAALLVNDCECAWLRMWVPHVNVSKFGS